jgi:hypothetical protein
MPRILRIYADFKHGGVSSWAIRKNPPNPRYQRSISPPLSGQNRNIGMQQYIESRLLHCHLDRVLRTKIDAVFAHVAL